MIKNQQDILLGKLIINMFDIATGPSHYDFCVNQVNNYYQ